MKTEIQKKSKSRSFLSAFYSRLNFFLPAFVLGGLWAPVWAAPPPGYNLVWSDEFNGAVGSAPNPSNWTYDTGAGGWGNNELENYTNSTANARIVADPNATDGEALAIIAIDTQPGNTNYSQAGRYTSARLKTQGLQSFQYGYMEARIQMPYGDGIWPAFWMLGNNITTVSWPACGEMDIMENIGNAADQPVNHGSLHAPNWNPTGTYTLPGAQLYHTAYHTFGLLWQPNQVQFYVDGTLFETQTSANCSSAGGTWEFNNNFFFLLNMAVGGSWPGSPDASTPFPQTMLVDYVRAYQLSSGTATPTPTPVVSSTWRVNAGGPQYADSQGNVWSADENYTGGTAAVTNSTITGALPGAGDQSLYQTQRYGNPFSYVFNVPAGSYQVTLKFAETYWTAVGQRVFNVSINGNTVLNNFDIFQTAGGQDKAIDEVFNNISPSGGAITIQFGPASADNAVVQAIQIIPQPATATPTYTTTNTRTNTPTYTFTNTKTNTPVPPTNTPTFTSISTNTGTSTFTRTNTSTNTATSTNTPVNTFTFTSTSTNTGTPTFTRTNTSTNTATSTNTPVNTFTFTSTSTNTGTSTFTRTNTSTNTATFTNTPVNTFTATSTATNTGTPTFTQTNTSTNTHTATFTNTLTSTPTFTRTSTNTPTNTGTSTNTPTGTVPPTNTPTSTGTSTHTSTSTNTPINTNTFTNTPTFTNTNTFTNTLTHTNTFTNTFTYTPTNTFTPTITNTPTNTPVITNTSNNTPTKTNTPTYTNTNTPTFTNTSTFTNTLTNTNTFTNTFTLIFTPTVTNTPTNTPVMTNTPTNTPTNSFTLTNTNTFTHTTTNTFTPTPTKTPTNVATSTVTNTPTFTNSFTATYTPTVKSTFTFTGTPTRTFTRTETPAVTPIFKATFEPEAWVYPPFPNPSNGKPITFSVQVPRQSAVTMDVFTLGFRKIVSQTLEAYGKRTFEWDLKDVSGVQVANGLYYVRVHVAGAISTTQILKVMILR